MRKKVNNVCLECKNQNWPKKKNNNKRKLLKKHGHRYIVVFSIQIGIYIILLFNKPNKT